MEPELWRQIENLYHRALEVDQAHRAAFLEEVCQGNEDLRREVESLLALDPRAAGFIESPAMEVAARLFGSEQASEGAEAFANAGPTVPGTVIGPYLLLRRIGQGGMGEVWLAEQSKPVRRSVAIKLIKAGMDTQEVIARFQSERQALAMMDHPAIAKVFDAGTTPEGRPYFVMEYVPGLPITIYCDRHQLNLRQRLELFVLVCGGVQHAHHKAIIHRDLKPSNILVSETDGKAMPRIIDFGVAKATSQQLSPETMVTRFGSVVGTLGYMSPEQADSAGQDIDTRSDVYSLGVVLYEMLAGSLPLDFYKLAYDEILRRLREQDPPSPSTKVRSIGGGPTDTAKNRGVDPPTLVRQLRGDPDAIVLKALEKDRRRRYSTPSDLAADIGRYLRDEPVSAHAPSAVYRARKYIRRHRALALSVAAVFLVLVAGVTVSTWEAIREGRAETRAQQEAASAQAVVDFLDHDLLAQANTNTQSGPDTKPDPDIKVRTALERAAQRIPGKFGNQPEVEASIRDTIGDTYSDLGLLPEARTQAERALELRKRVLGPDNLRTLQTTILLCKIADRQAKFDEAEALCGGAAQISRRVFGAESPFTLTAMGDLANVDLEQSKYAQAEATLSQIAEIDRRLLGPENPETLNSMTGLGWAYNGLGKHAQAEAIWEQTLEIDRRVFGPEHSSTLNTMQNLASCYETDGKFSKATALDKKILELRRHVQGPEHPATLNAMNNLGSDLDSEGKYEESQALLTQTLALERRVLGAEHPDTLMAMANLAYSYGSEGRYREAEELSAQTLNIMQRVQGPEHPNTLLVVSNLTYFYRLEGKYDAAETYASKSLAGYQHSEGAESTDTTGAEVDLALAYLGQGKFAQSEELARGAFEVDSKIEPEDWQRYRAESLLGASLAGEKKFAEAEPLLLNGYQGMEARKDAISAPDRYCLKVAQNWIVHLYQDWGKPEKAAEWKKK